MEKMGLFQDFPILQSQTLILKKIEERDLDDLFEIYSNDELFRYRPGKAKKNRNTVKNMIGHFAWDFNKKKMIFLGICRNDETQKLIGVAEIFDLDEKAGMITIGYTINQQYWHKGYASESTRLMVDFLFGKIGLNRIQAFVMPENERSKNVLLKNHFVKEGLMREGAYWKERGIVDTEVYSILKREYH